MEKVTLWTLNPLQIFKGKVNVPKGSTYAMHCFNVSMRKEVEKKQVAEVCNWLEQWYTEEERRGALKSLRKNVKERLNEYTVIFNK